MFPRDFEGGIVNPHPLSAQVADLEAERDQLVRAHAKQLPEAVARELYQRGYRAGYSAGRRRATRRGPYSKTRSIIGE